MSRVSESTAVPEQHYDDRECIDDEEETPDGIGSCDAFTAGFRLLFRNKQLAMVFLASSLQMGASGLANIFVLSDLKVQYWGKHMSEYTAMSSMMLNVVAVLCGGLFGRFSDAVDRRLAASLFAVGTFLPGWSLLLCGQNRIGLLAATLATIIGAFGLTSNVMLALVNDVTPFEDREVACGTYFACMNLMSLLLNAVPVLLILVLKVVPNSPNIILSAQLVLSLLFFVCVWSVKPTKQPVESEEKSNHWDCSCLKETSSPEVGGNEKSWLCRSVGVVCEPMKLAFGNGRLRRLCLAAFCLKFGSDLVMDIGLQFFNDCLGLLDEADEANKARRDSVITVAVLTMLPGQFMAIPGNLITGYLAKKVGTLKLLRILVPISSVLVAVGALMALVRQMWFIAVVVICLTYASMTAVPLLRMVAGVAPPGRMGEALAAVGVFAQSAGLIGNFLVAVMNPLLLRTSLTNPLWVYYPTCACIVLMAIIPLSGTPRGGWGPASGKPKELLISFVSSVVGWNRWKRFVCRRRMASGQQLSSEQLRNLRKHEQFLEESRRCAAQSDEDEGSSSGDEHFCSRCC